MHRRRLNTAQIDPEVVIDPVLEALPVGVAVISADRRIVSMNPAFHESLDLPPNSILPGTLVEDAVRASAHRGVYGPGDPEAQVAAVLAPDRSIAGPPAPPHVPRPQLRPAQRAVAGWRLRGVRG